MYFTWDEVPGSKRSRASETGRRKSRRGTSSHNTGSRGVIQKKSMESFQNYPDRKTGDRGKMKRWVAQVRGVGSHADVPMSIRSEIRVGPGDVI